MSVAAVEAVPALESAGAGAAGAAGGRAAAGGSGRHAASRRAPAARAADDAAVAAAAGQGGPEPSRRERAQKFAKEHVPRGKIERTNYQPIILMEFVACILLTAATPMATKKGQPGLSPYAGKDIVKLSAITIVYLILAMLSVGGRTPGRFAAWFGGLILLADGLYEANNIVRDLQVFSGAGAAVPVPDAGADIITPASSAAAARGGLSG